MTVFNSVDEFIDYEGRDLGASESILVTQEMINLFADATLDHQWIHIDPERALRESHFETTIAHGYLTLSLVPYLLNQLISVNNLDHIVNYGIDKLTFKSVVRSGDNIQLRASIKSVKDLGDACIVTISCNMISTKEDTTVMRGDIKFIYYFK